MTLTLLTWLIVLAVGLGGYVFAATLLCNELNDDDYHWWCPLCAITKRRKL